MWEREQEGLRASGTCVEGVAECGKTVANGPLVTASRMDDQVKGLLSGAGASSPLILAVGFGQEGSQADPVACLGGGGRRRGRNPHSAVRPSGVNAGGRASGGCRAARGATTLPDAFVLTARRCRAGTVLGSVQ